VQPPAGISTPPGVNWEAHHNCDQIAVVGAGVVIGGVVGGAVVTGGAPLLLAPFELP